MPASRWRVGELVVARATNMFCSGGCGGKEKEGRKEGKANTHEGCPGEEMWLGGFMSLSNR